MTNQELIEKLKNDKERIEKLIENRLIYNIRNFFLRNLIRTGKTLDFFLPLILASVVMSQSGVNVKNLLLQSENVMTIDNSNDLHLIYDENDNEYDLEDGIEYSTGWTVDDKGVFSREVTFYKLKKDIDYVDINKFLSMTKEEIEDLIIESSSTKVIQKYYLTQEDYYYADESITVVNHHVDEKREKFNKKINIFNNDLYNFLAIIILFGILKGGINFYTKDVVSNFLDEKEELVRPMTDEDVEKLMKIIELREENIDLLKNDNLDSQDDNIFVFKPRCCRRV